jgi:hypothetical protein
VLRGGLCLGGDSAWGLKLKGKKSKWSQKPPKVESSGKCVCHGQHLDAAFTFALQQRGIKNLAGGLLVPLRPIGK